ncbi:hypothetical protein [Brevibacterium senegalense]|uniref:hypothetical protein n=1 Tax=Brevibacterium senegalense TaxID=1033736 RepID=UPI00036A60E8|nr:hypothetical protein [Brevibacterium senegalense]
MIERPRDKQGDRDEYFTCSGCRRKNGCTRSAIIIDRIEDRIESTYNTNGFTAAEADRVREVLGTVFDQLEVTTDDERSLLLTQKEKLDAERLKLVQAHYADAIPLDLRKSEQDRIRTNLDAIEHRLENLATSPEDAREGLDQLADILTDLGDVYARCEPAERRILNRALFDKIILDDEDHVDYVPTDAVSVTIAQARAIQPPDLGTKKNLPRHQAGQVSNFSSLVEVARQCSNLAPALTRAVSSHHAIRRRDSLVRQESLKQLPRPVTRLTETMLLEAERRYRGGEILRTIAKDLGVSRERLSSHLRERGVRLRREKPTPALVLEMCRRYEQGESLARVGARLGFNPSSVRVTLLAAGVKLRDTHGRVR